ncbi:DNA-3-methyladenine glycosylase I [Nonlabens sp. Ci31]|jgi:DNA-3-methyladenine glycosylase I|uniref:DNA-3-methyladenine glycosylase I n=1 Tax=Nonlabens sp. Ci31 TaxID=2608253 RepID=UPI001462B622|nr:DNA-3-methyladenine glycosylase I [Nonlabens sp. Ci31]QJP33884.1 DNA-3-methyladenine glycosylase I [Nonlabens sp. Ci31]
MKKQKCDWCRGDVLYESYHDKEWGKPVYDDQTLFEFLILESMQAGLSWITILRKRQNYSDALNQFDVQKIAAYDQEKQEELLQNAGIIRHKLKVKSIVNNAQLFIEVQKEYGSFSKYVWNYVEGKPIKNQVQNHIKAPANTALSDQIAKDLKKRGFQFVGSTIVYAFMQATGMVNDHEITCFRYDEV